MRTVIRPVQTKRFFHSSRISTCTFVPAASVACTEGDVRFIVQLAQSNQKNRTASVFQLISQMKDKLPIKSTAKVLESSNNFLKKQMGGRR